MGLIIGDDFEKEVYCEALFPDGAPSYVEAVVAGVIACPGIAEDPNGTYILTPNVLCRWRYYPATLRLFWFANTWDGFDWHSAFRIDYDALDEAMFHSFGVPGQTHYENDYTITDCAIFSHGYGGTVDLYWGPGIGP